MINYVVHVQVQDFATAAALVCLYMCMTLYAEKCVDCFRALPSLLDSDEEVVTTRYEMSKMQ